MLAAIDHVVIAIGDRTRRRGHDVRAGTGFCQRKALVFFTAHAGFKILLDLLTFAGEEYLCRSRDKGAQGIADRAEFPLHETERRIVEPAATNRLRQICGVKTHVDCALLDALADLCRHARGFVGGSFMRFDVLVYEGPKRVKQHGLFVSELVIHVSIFHFALGRRQCEPIMGVFVPGKGPDFDVNSTNSTNRLIQCRI